MSLKALISLFAAAFITGCAITPDYDSDKSVQLRSEHIPANLSYVFVINDFPVSAPYRTASVDGGDRILIGSMMFYRFDLSPGEHIFSIASTVNTERLTVDALPGQAKYIKIGYEFSWDGGHGDVAIVLDVLTEAEGKSILQTTQAVE